MSLREAILTACLVALGVVGFREQSARNQRELSELLRREQALTRELTALRLRDRCLRREADALQHDRYYIERVARADLGWRPSSQGEPGLSPPGMPDAVALAPNSLLPMSPVPSPGTPQAPPAPGPTQPPAPGPVTPQPSPLPIPPGAPPATPQADAAAAQQVVAVLGYSSVEHFQAKMMNGRADGAAGQATLARAQQLAQLLQRLGYDSVKAFQKRNRLTPDGVMGRVTEQRALALLRRKAPTRSAGYVASNPRSRRND